MSLLAVLDESEEFLTLAQKRMLDAVLGEGAVSDAAIRDWAAAVDINALDAASYRLVPALCARAGSNPALRPLYGRMKGIYRYFFYRNNRFLTFVERVFSALVAAGIDFIVFKGTSTLLQYYRSAALRSFSDCDILVQRRDKERAEEVLVTCGLSYRYDAERKLRDRHSHDFVDAAENGFDLHWYSLLESCEERIDDGLWSRSHHIEWKNLRLRVLAPEDELLVAGMGGIREPMNARVDWIYDAWLILKATPDFDWRLLHEELKRRKLQLSFMSAIGLLHRFVPHFPNVAVEKEFFHEIRSVVERLVAENRTFGLDPETDRQLTAALSFPAGFRRFVGAIFGGDKRERIARSGNVTRYMRYCSHEDGSISHLYCHRDVRTFLDDIFDVVDSTELRQAKNYARRREDVHLCLPSGVLRVPPKARPQQYAARVNADNQLLQFVTPDITSLSVVVRITNDASRPWHVLACDDCQFGLSYHLVADGGECVSWDLPRRYFLVALRNQVALLLPGDSLQVELEILRPPAPGRYEARLDVAHERIAWFDPNGQHFPRLPIEVL
jgi:hypothetical protein